ncbi:Rpn family recombination-promoting nuclease/putative transposase [Ileibacterium valens]|uniref:Rpn family recombination-promoting nuclease/putative transposase n=2 Tax=Ileibacterium valens TaxID=1862668 RepID=UPI00257334D5|nr:Rpn family recombination-promoting nuclease/putative transposase [Ileibacterium valens]
MNQKNRKIPGVTNTDIAGSQSSALKKSPASKPDIQSTKSDGKMELQNISTEIENQRDVRKRGSQNRRKSKRRNAKTASRNKSSDKALDEFFQNKSRAADLFETAFGDEIGPIDPKRLRLGNSNQKLLGKDALRDIDRSNDLLYVYQDENGKEALFTLILEDQKYSDCHMLKRVLDSCYAQAVRWLEGKESETKVNAKNKTKKINEYFPEIFPVVFHHRHGPRNEPCSLSELTRNKSGRHFDVSYVVIEPEDLKESCKDADNRYLGLGFDLLHKLERKAKAKQNGSDNQSDNESLLIEFEQLVIGFPEDVIKVMKAEAGVPDKIEEWIDQKRLNEQKEEGEQMSVLRELYDNRDRKLEDYDRMVKKISKAEQRANQIQEEKDRQIEKLLEHIRKSEPDFRLE